MSWNDLLGIRETLGILSEPILPILPELKKDNHSLLKNNLFLSTRSTQNGVEQSGLKLFQPVLSQLKAAVYDRKNNPIDLAIEQLSVNSIPEIALIMRQNILQPDSLSSFLPTVEAFAQEKNVFQPDSLSSFLPTVKAFVQEEAIASVNLNIDLSNPDQFYDLPYPSNLRLNDQGVPVLSGVPILEGNFLTGSLKSIVGDRFGFPTTATGYFQFNIPVSDQDPNRVIPANVDESILLVELESGRLLPTVASNLLPEEHYVNGFTLAVAPAPGIVLRPGYTYAYVVNRSLNDSSGEALGVSNTISELIQGEVPDSPIGLAAKDLYDPLGSLSLPGEKKILW